MSDSRIETWRSWLKDIVYDARTMHLRRDVMQGVSKMVRESELPPSYYWQYLGDTYAATQVLAIRRQADRGRGVVSLGRLIGDIGANADYMTREAFLEPWGDDPHDQQYAGRQFDHWSVGSKGKHLDAAVPRADLKALDESAAHVKDYADKHLAHSDEARTRDDVPTFDEIDAAVLGVGALIKKYGHLLTAADHVLHVVLPNPWFLIFRQPWLRAGAEPPIVPPPGVF